MRTPFTLAFILLSFFGYSQSNWTQVEAYDGFVRHHPVTFSIDGFGYLLTGRATFGDLADFWRYDPVEDSWEKLPDFPGGARGFSYGVAHQGKAYVGFGLTQTGAPLNLADLWEYDPATESWRELSRCPGLPRHHPAFVALNGKLFVGLGGNLSLGDLKDWWVYDIATDTWEKKSDLPASARHHPFYFGIGDYVYAGMGHSGPIIFDDLYRYDLSTDTWEEMASIPGQGRVAGTQFDYQGEGYVLGGQNEQHQNFPVGEFWKYTPETNSWTELEAFPFGSRWAPGSFRIDNLLFFTSGEDNIGGFNNDVWMFDLGGTVDDDEIIQLEDRLDLFPNPVSSILQVDLSNADLDLATANVYDTNGKLILSTEINNGTISVAALPVGVYKLVLEHEEKVFVESFVKL